MTSMRKFLWFFPAGSSAALILATAPKVMSHVSNPLPPSKAIGAPSSEAFLSMSDSPRKQMPLDCRVVAVGFDLDQRMVQMRAWAFFEAGPIC